MTSIWEAYLKWLDLQMRQCRSDDEFMDLRFEENYALVMSERNEDHKAIFERFVAEMRELATEKENGGQNNGL